MRCAWIGTGLIGLVFAGASACAGSPSVSESGAGGAGAGAQGSGGEASSGNPSGTGGDDLIAVTSSSGGGTGPGTTTGAGGMGGQACGSGTGGAVPMPETCDNGKDEDLNGFIDESCQCSPGATQMCFPGSGDICACVVGTQKCVQAGEFGQWGPCEGAAQACVGLLDNICEVCGNALDDDCDGQIDENCLINLTVNIDGDCVTATCPPQAPYPVGCNIDMDGNDLNGCVANVPGSSEVFFKEGKGCGSSGHVSGTLSCSSVQGAPLNENNCPIDKFFQHHETSPGACPN